MREEEKALLTEAVRRGLLPLEALAAPGAEGRPWPLVLLIGLGAWLAALALGTGLGAIGIFLFEDLSGPCLVMGLILTGSAVFGLRRGRLPLFAEQLCLPGLFAGMGLCCFAAGNITNSESWAASVLLVLCLLAALCLRAGWLRFLLACLAAAAGAWLIGEGVQDYWYRSEEDAALVTGYALLLIWLLTLALRSVCGAVWGRSGLALFWEQIGSGWLLVSLVLFCLYSGSSFLVGGSSAFPRRAFLSGWPDEAWISALSLACTLAASVWLLFVQPFLRRPLVCAAALAAAGLSFFMPALGPVLLGLGVALGDRSRFLSVAAALAAAWIIGAFYYQLHLPLIEKAWRLMAAGLLLGGFSLLARRRQGGKEAHPAAASSPKQPRTGAKAAAAGCGGMLLAVLVAVNWSIWQKEQIIAQGHPLFVPLAPVDPRSLMQGDFMRLRFDLPAMTGRNDPEQAPCVIVSVDNRGVGQLTEDPGNAPLRSGQYRVRLTRSASGWIFVSDAWYFREGEGARWEKARYGEFRILPGGGALLVGMADQKLKPIR